MLTFVFSCSIVEDGLKIPMFLFIIFLSYLLGCVTIIALLIYLYVRYGLYPIGTIVEQEQYQTFHPLPEVSLHFLKYFLYVSIHFRMTKQKILQ
jgi:hypothetical protein